MSDWEEKLPSRVRERLNQVGQIKSAFQPGLTLEDFQKAVQQRKKEKGISFVLALYQVLDEFVAEEIKNSGVVLACKKGCSYCCYQMIACTKIEMDEIVKFVDGLPRPIRIPLLRRIRGFVSQWRDYFGRNEFSLKINSLKVYEDWHGKPCPFLNESDGSCDVYPVRIIDCRTASSLISCGPGIKGNWIIPTPLYEKKPGRCRFQSELWANNLILEEEQRRVGLADPRLVQVTPLHHWLWMRRKELS